MADLVDLTPARRKRVDWDLRVRGAAILAGLVLAVGGWADLLMAPSPPPFGVLGRIALLILGAGGAFVVVQTLRLNAGPVALVLDSTAVTLQMPRGRSRVLRWSDSSSTFILLDLRGSPQAVGGYGQRRPYVTRRSGLIWLAPGPPFDITPEALEEILSTAAAAGRMPMESLIRFGSFSSVRRIELRASAS
jgi:hypothetical protein